MSAAWDVAVVGGGAAGIAAARAAHGAGAARVVLVRDGVGATGMSAGWIAASDASADLATLAWLPAVGLRPVGAYAFAAVSGAVAAAVSGLPSLLDLSELPDGSTLGVVDLVAGPAWSAELVARALTETLQCPVRVVVPAGDVARGNSPCELARVFDTMGVVEALATALRAPADGCGALLFPPVLGLARDDVAARLAALLGRPVGEAGGGMAEPPGLRMTRAFERGVPRGVEVVRGRATVSAGTPDGAVVQVAERTLRARAVVLATGGLPGGGLAFDGRFHEPCAGAPVWLPTDARSSALGGAVLPVLSAARGMDPAPLFAPDVHGRVGALAAGVRLRPDGRVVGPDGTEALRSWLFAAGGVVAGGRGVSGPALADVLAAGHAAGLRAARYASGQDAVLAAGEALRHSTR